jgi:carbamoyl-phosphate synthase large subunit
MKVLVIGSGPIIIGQAAEFDYAGTQACKALREEGITSVLVNSNPATIMTDEGIADITYIEPLTTNSLKRIIELEHPDGLLPTLGGQNALNLAVSLAQSGILDHLGVRLLGTPLATIQQAEDRASFKHLLQRIGEPVPLSASVTDVSEALTFAQEAGFPLIVRPSFTLGGTGGGIATTPAELETVVGYGLSISPIQQVLVERYLAGWKEIEYEVMRDADDTCVTVCNMENIDPMGVHTGDSIVVAPSQTLSDKEYHLLRSAAFKIIRALGVEGGCNIQFALDPCSSRYYVIEVNPRVSRSSALASKATGYPIARVATKIAIGKRLAEIPNAATGTTCAAFEPALDYVVVKIPRWPFDKFPQAEQRIGSQMKAIGEVMAIDRNFEAALQKAVRALELDERGLLWEPGGECDLSPTHLRLWHMMTALRADSSPHALQYLHNVTGIDTFYLHKLRRLVAMEQRLRSEPFTPTLLREAKRRGFSDQQIALLTNSTASAVRSDRLRSNIRPVFKMVDTCAGEFAATTAYFYSTYEQENEAQPFHEPAALVLGSGPIRIGQGIEFDYCSVKAAQTLRDAGWRSILLNSNPETVSTDFDLSDRLYFEPLDEESVLDILENEAAGDSNVPLLVQTGGQTALNLVRRLARQRIEVPGTSIESIEIAEDRQRFQALLKRLHIPGTQGYAVSSPQEALAVVERIGFPVLLRPSYVLGGRAMKMIHNRAALQRSVHSALQIAGAAPLLIDAYIPGKEVEVDLVCDGREVLIPGIMEHIERAGIHSGDSIAVYPPLTLTPHEIATIVQYAAEISRALTIRGLLNIQYIINDNGVFVLEANPRASRTVPFISKATGIPLVTLATRVMLGQTLEQTGYQPGLSPQRAIYAVKAPVYSHAKLPGLELSPGPEMTSTGEVMGLDATYEGALGKACLAAGLAIPPRGSALVTVDRECWNEAAPLLVELTHSGYTCYTLSDTTDLFTAAEIACTPLLEEAGAFIRQKRVDCVIDLRADQSPYHIDSVDCGQTLTLQSPVIRRAAIEAQIPCFTVLETFQAVLRTLRYNPLLCFEPKRIK